jgi:hypothetical protein
MLSVFYQITGEMILSAEFLSYRADIFNTLHLIMDNVKASKSDFASSDAYGFDVKRSRSTWISQFTGMITELSVFYQHEEMILSAESSAIELIFSIHFT